MTTASAATAYAGLDLTASTRPSMATLVKVEIRKMVDTRAGMWLMITIAAVTVVATTIFGLAGHDRDRTFSNFMQFAGAPQGILLPVLGILLVTQEWSQRTAMVTFSLEPRRPLVILAKLVVGLGLAVLAVVIALVLATLCNALYGVLGDDPVTWNASLAHTGGFVLLQVIGMLTGFAFATLLLNSPAAIVLYMVYSFVLPGLFELGAQLMDWFDGIRPWIDFNNDQNNLIDATIHGKEWAQLFVAGVIWLVVPLVVGIWRIRRAEVK